MHGSCFDSAIISRLYLSPIPPWYDIRQRVHVCSVQLFFYIPETSWYSFLIQIVFFFLVKQWYSLTLNLKTFIAFCTCPLHWFVPNTLISILRWTWLVYITTWAILKPRVSQSIKIGSNQVILSIDDGNRWKLIN